MPDTLGIFLINFSKELGKNIYIHKSELEIALNANNVTVSTRVFNELSEKILVISFTSTIEKLFVEMIEDLSKESFKFKFRQGNNRIEFKYEEVDPLYIFMTKEKMKAYLKAMFIKSIVFGQLKIIVATISKTIISRTRGLKSHEEIVKEAEKHFKNASFSETKRLLKSFFVKFFELSVAVVD